MLRNRHHQALLGLFVISMAIAPAAQAADGACGIDSLKGRYGFQASGRVDVPTRGEARIDLSNVETVHFSQVGTIETDGEGHASIKMTGTGDKASPATNQGSAVYTVNPDCTGTIRFLVGDPEADAAEKGPGYAFVLKPDNTFSFISTITGMVLTGSAWQITDTASELISVGTQATLNGGQCNLICPPGYWFYFGTGSCIPC
ncbi:hypothetical protein ACR2R6_17780 [Methylocaldum gracile subsp. desertum]|uniref:hypothetical protein n=1 Tax=Methylocaldum sp. GT1BW TaxID=3438964 RepID=UPI003DA0AFBC